MEYICVQQLNLEDVHISTSGCILFRIKEKCLPHLSLIICKVASVVCWAYYRMSLDLTKSFTLIIVQTYVISQSFLAMVPTVLFNFLLLNAAWVSEKSRFSDYRKANIAHSKTAYLVPGRLGVGIGAGCLKYNFSQYTFQNTLTICL